MDYSIPKPHATISPITGKPRLDPAVLWPDLPGPKRKQLRAQKRKWYRMQDEVVLLLGSKCSQCGGPPPFDIVHLVWAPLKSGMGKLVAIKAAPEEYELRCLACRKGIKAHSRLWNLFSNES